MSLQWCTCKIELLRFRSDYALDTFLPRISFVVVRILASLLLSNLVASQPMILRPITIKVRLKANAFLPREEVQSRCAHFAACHMQPYLLIFCCRFGFPDLGSHAYCVVEFPMQRFVLKISALGLSRHPCLHCTDHKEDLHHARRELLLYCLYLHIDRYGPYDAAQPHTYVRNNTARKACPQKQLFNSAESSQRKLEAKEINACKSKR